MTFDLISGDRVALITKPHEVQGVVLDVHFGVAVVKWDTGRHWRYCLRPNRLLVLA